VSGDTGSGEAEGPTIDPRIWQRRLSIQRSRGRRRLQWIGGVVAVFLLVVVVVALLHTRWFSAQVITVTGTHAHTSDAAIVEAAGLEHHPALISVDPGATAKKVEALPFIASAQIHRHWPDGVAISVTERAPVVQMAGPGPSWSILDGDGRTLQVQPSKLPGLVVYTVGSGVSTMHPAPLGGTLPASAAAGLVVSRTLPPAFSAQVVSVSLAADGSISLALDSGITVLLGSDADLRAKYEDVAAIIAHGSLRATSTIDVTVPESPTVGG
jgi:cell division protein FtsQ